MPSRQRFPWFTALLQTLLLLSWSVPPLWAVPPLTEAQSSSAPKSAMGDPAQRNTATLQETISSSRGLAPAGLDLQTDGQQVAAPAPEFLETTSAIHALAPASVSVGRLCVELHAFRGPPRL